MIILKCVVINDNTNIVTVDFSKTYNKISLGE